MKKSKLSKKEKNINQGLNCLTIIHKCLDEASCGHYEVASFKASNDNSLIVALAVHKDEPVIDIRIFNNNYVHTEVGRYPDLIWQLSNLKFGKVPEIIKS